MRTLSDRLLSLLYQLAGLLVTAKDREWLSAIQAESVALGNRREAWLWSMGALPLLMRALAHRLIGDLYVLPIALAAGLIMAYVDLTSTDRWPAALMSLAFTAVLAFARPDWAWRWALAVTLVLPLAVNVGFEGPYRYEPFDAYYKVPQALLMAGLAAWLRFKWDQRRRREA